MEWSSDLESGGGGFDSRLTQVIFGFLFGRVGIFFREFWNVLGCVWEWFGDVFGQVLEGLGKYPTRPETKNKKT